MKGSKFSSFLCGAIVGGVVALLLAPKSGRETREDITLFAEDAMERTKNAMSHGYEQAKTAVNNGLNYARENAPAMVEKAIDKAENALHKGEHKMEKTAHNINKEIDKEIDRADKNDKSKK